jgi:hypothetical protein
MTFPLGIYDMRLVQRTRGNDFILNMECRLIPQKILLEL